MIIPFSLTYYLLPTTNRINKIMTITSGVRCNEFNFSIDGSLVSSHVLDSEGMWLAVDIACITSQARYKMVDAINKCFSHIVLAVEHSGDFVHFYVDTSKPQDITCAY